MTTKIAQASSNLFQPAASKHSTPAADYSLPPLPTFDLEVGWREVYNPKTGKHEQLPLTLLDILYPQEEDVDVVIMPQSPLHDLWIRWLAVMLESYLGARHWLVTHDVLIHWGRRGAPAKSPDVAVMAGGQRPAAKDKSYRVGRDGPLPVFVLEITSEETRPEDLQGRPLLYAAVGIKEYLIIDFWTPDQSGPWPMIGYRLEDSPYYRQITPDAEGGLTFEIIGLRFVAVGRERIEIYSVETGARLLTPVEVETARVEAETRAAEAEVRADTEKAARLKAEAHVAELETRLRELEARYEPQSKPEADPPVDE